MKLEDLLAKLDTNRPKPRPANIPGVGQVFVLPLTVDQIDAVPDEPSAADDATKRRGVVRSIAMALCDAEGKRYGLTPELLTALGAQPWEDIQEVRKAIEGPAAKND